jgi:hypothetical protein
MREVSVEKFQTQCPCGHPFTVLIWPPDGKHKVSRIAFYARRRRGAGLCQRTRCPTCDRDFSRITPELFKEELFGTGDGPFRGQDKPVD